MCASVWSICGIAIDCGGTLSPGEAERGGRVGVPDGGSKIKTIQKDTPTVRSKNWNRSLLIQE